VTEELKPLSKKHKLVQDKYLVYLNQEKAYSEVYPDASPDSAKASASRLFTDVNFRAHLEARLCEAHLTADEALKLQADIARGDITEFFTGYGNIDWDKFKGSGKGRLVKKIKTRTITKIGKGEKDDDTEIVETELELYPADTAQERILKVEGKFTNKIDVTTDGKPLQKDELTDEERMERMKQLAQVIAQEIKKVGS
jgi:hypothetical protein